MSLGWIISNEKKVNSIFLGLIKGKIILFGGITSKAFIFILMKKYFFVGFLSYKKKAGEKYQTYKIEIFCFEIY